MYSGIMKRIHFFDNYVLFSIKKHMQNKYLDRIMPVVTGMGNLGVIWILIALGLIVDKPYRDIGNLVLVTLIVSTIIGEGIVKHIVRRGRPCSYLENTKLLIAKPISYSFPSGHTLSSFAVAGVLSTYISQYRLIFLGIALLIAISRLYLFVHYPTDVIAGIIIGVLCSKLICILLQGGAMANAAVLYSNIF